MTTIDENSVMFIGRKMIIADLVVNQMNISIQFVQFKQISFFFFSFNKIYKEIVYYNIIPMPRHIEPNRIAVELAMYKNMYHP